MDTEQLALRLRTWAGEDRNKVRAADMAEAADEIECLKDRVWAAYLAGFCSSTVEFNGDTHGHNPVNQQTDWHWDNYEAWGFLDDETEQP